jgi:hypothetical protein
MALAPSPTGETAMHEMDNDVVSDVDGIRASDSNGSVSERLLLQDRIQNRKNSIRTIEALLKTHSDDAGMRRCLYRKKQALYEDLIRLNLLTN